MSTLIHPTEHKHGNAGLMRSMSASYWIYGALIAGACVLQTLKVTLPVQVNPGQQTSWLYLAIVAVLGLIGVILSPRTGFPEMWDTRISATWRLWLPIVVGLFLGAVMVAFDLVRPMGTDMQTQFPDSLVIYPLGGLLEEILIHLFVLPLLIWLVSGLVLRGKYQMTTFWVVAVIGGIGYWALQMTGLATMAPELFSPALAAQLFLIIVGTITGGAFLFRKGGFLAALLFRYGFYALWHIVWAGGIGLVRYFS